MESIYNSHRDTTLGLTKLIVENTKSPALQSPLEADDIIKLYLRCLKTVMSGKLELAALGEKTI
jgi:hypothetical protein